LATPSLRTASLTSSLIVKFTLLIAFFQPIPVQTCCWTNIFGDHWEQITNRSSQIQSSVVVAMTSHNVESVERVEQQLQTTGFVTSSVKRRSPSLSPDSSSSSMKLVDPVVKAFKDDMDMEGYIGKHTF